MSQKLSLRGVEIWKGYLSPSDQSGLVNTLRDAVAETPFFASDTPYGKPMSVRMTSMGRAGWYSDRTGYRYVSEHPNGSPWPDIPDSVLAIWKALVSADRHPDCCLLNYYGEGAKMGMHQDRDEADFAWPVLSISLGDSALFRVGNQTRGGSTESIWLDSGDIAVMGGDARLLYHGIDRVKFQSSPLLPKGGRINLTCRVVT